MARRVHKVHHSRQDVAGQCIIDDEIKVKVHKAGFDNAGVRVSFIWDSHMSGAQGGMRQCRHTKVVHIGFPYEWGARQDSAMQACGWFIWVSHLSGAQLDILSRGFFGRSGTREQIYPFPGPFWSLWHQKKKNMSFPAWPCTSFPVLAWWLPRGTWSCISFPVLVWWLPRGSRQIRSESSACSCMSFPVPVW